MMNNDWKLYYVDGAGTIIANVNFTNTTPVIPRIGEFVHLENQHGGCDRFKVSCVVYKPSTSNIRVILINLGAIQYEDK